jgi:hypothetical protein
MFSSKSKKAFLLELTFSTTTVQVYCFPKDIFFPSVHRSSSLYQLKYTAVELLGRFLWKHRKSHWYLPLLSYYCIVARDRKTPTSVGEYFHSRFAEFLAAGVNSKNPPKKAVHCCRLSCPRLCARFRKLLSLKDPDTATKQVHQYLAHFIKH